MIYNTICENSKHQIIEKKSKFIGMSFYVSSTKEAEGILEKLRKDFFDARHICFAYRIMSNDNNIIERYSDDGEPSKTAGLPIFNNIKSGNYINVLVVVIRYFGGILLGTGLLTRTYSNIARETIALSGNKELKSGMLASTILKYEEVEYFRRLSEQFKFVIVDLEYSDIIKAIFKISEKSLEVIKTAYEVEILKKNILF